MLDLHIYILFLATAVVMVLSPGPDTVLALSRTVANGSRAGLMTLFGTQLGNVIQAVLAGIGVSTLVLLFPDVFDALKYLGAAYLLYLAFQAWRSTDGFDLNSDSKHSSRPSYRYFIQGLINNLTNPKMIGFFLALFPQFIEPSRGELGLQSLILGATLAAMALLWIGFLVLLLGRFRRAVGQSATFAKIANRLAALTFVGLALRLATEHQR